MAVPNQSAPSGVDAIAQIVSLPMRGCERRS
jgi:hypothetical protein